jgi:hypothetical protein
LVHQSWTWQSTLFCCIMFLLLENTVMVVFLADLNINTCIQASPKKIPLSLSLCAKFTLSFT